MSDFPPLPDASGTVSVRSMPVGGNLAAPVGLGSLAQSARRKQIRVARTILLLVSLLNLLVGGVLCLGGGKFIDIAIDREIEKAVQEGKTVDHDIVDDYREKLKSGALLAGLMVSGLGLFYLLMAGLVLRFPVPSTIISLVVCLALTAADIAVDPASLLTGGLIGLGFRIAIIAGLVRAVLAALPYQRDLKRVVGKPGASGLGADL